MDLIYDFLAQAVHADASDVHLKVGQPPIYRLEGDLMKADAPPLSLEDLTAFVNDILSPQLRDIYLRNNEVDFAWNFAGSARFRVNLFSSGNEPTLAMRYVKNRIRTFADLHLPAILGEIAMYPRGIVLVGGTTGSGKSTTLASMLEHVNSNTFARIITIEDPIEYIFQDDLSIISQREVGFDTASFKLGFKNALRQDPDIIMVGEIRDPDSVGTAMSAAETGHLILSTVHVDSAAQVVSRILDMFPAEERMQWRLALANTLKAVICQRLVPDAYGKSRPAIEIMINTPIVKKLIIEENIERLNTAIETGGEDGMVTFNQSLYKLAQDKIITEETALMHASNPEALKMNFKGIFLDTSKRIIGR